MRPAYLTLAAVGKTPWVVLDRNLAQFGADIAVIPSSDSGFTYTVQHTSDPFTSPDYEVPCMITRAGALATVTFPYQHGMSTGDALLVHGSGSVSLDSQGYTQSPNVLQWASNSGQQVPWDVTVLTPTTLTYVCPNAGPAASQFGCIAKIQRVFPNAQLVNQTLRGNTNYAFAPTAVRLAVVSGATGYVQIQVIQGGGI